MSNEARRQLALEDIRQNIERHGHHTYVVSGPPDPRFAYTIGLSQVLGFELILAGAILYLLDDVQQIISQITAALTQEAGSTNLEVAPLGSFTLHRADSSWVKALMLGALNFYQVEDVPALQIVPDSDHSTIDVPDMRERWGAETAPVWRWLHESWTFPVPLNSMATTNLDALRGTLITEAVRWEEDYWELFAGAGPDVPKEQTRVVPLGTLIAADPSLAAVMSLRIGKGLWRDETSDWHSWKERS